jgi:ornithine carbamoyltransferase
MRMKRIVFWVVALSMLALPVFALADMKGHEGMAGMKNEPGGMKMEGHDMAKMGDRAFSGKIGSWKGDARIMDMKAHMAASGMKAQGAMPNSHHIALTLTDAAKKAVTEGKGTVTVTGPDKKSVTSVFMAMQGHFGADVNLPAPGKYTFKAEIESGGTKGSATFPYTLK